MAEGQTGRSAGRPKLFREKLWPDSLYTIHIPNADLVVACPIVSRKVLGHDGYVAAGRVECHEKPATQKSSEILAYWLAALHIPDTQSRCDNPRMELVAIASTREMA